MPSERIALKKGSSLDQAPSASFNPTQPFRRSKNGRSLTVWDDEKSVTYRNVADAPRVLIQIEGGDLTLTNACWLSWEALQEDLAKRGIEVIL